MNNYIFAKRIKKKLISPLYQCFLIFLIEGWLPTKSHRICELHFKRSDVAHRYLPSDAEPLLQPREREIPTHQALKGYTKILINIE